MTWELTDEVKKKYLKDGGSCCPRCGATDDDLKLIQNGVPQYMGNTLQDKVSCEPCGLVWWDIYVLSDIVIDD